MELPEEHYLFEGLSASQLDRIGRHVTHHSVAAGQMLFSRGDQAHSFYLLEKGSIVLFRVSPDGGEKIMRFIQPGQTFAESVMFMSPAYYPVHARGEADSRLLAINASSYLGLMEESFETCRRVFARMTERIQAHWDEIEALSLQNSRYRVIHYLLGLMSDAQDSNGAWITLPARKALIAAQLALTPETLSRILRELDDNELIKMDGYSVRIPDPTALRRQIA